MMGATLVTKIRRVMRHRHTVKSDDAVTSIKQSPVLKGHIFCCPVIENFI